MHAFAMSMYVSMYEMGVYKMCTYKIGVCSCKNLLSIYIIESVRLFVCLFVRGKRQNYGTD